MSKSSSSRRHPTRAALHDALKISSSPDMAGLPAQQAPKNSRATISATTRAQNRKNAEEAQLKEANAILATPRTAKVQALSAAIWTGVAGKKPTAASDAGTVRATVTQSRKRALSSAITPQSKEPNKKKSKADANLKPKKTHKSSSAKRPTLSRTALEDDVEDDLNLEDEDPESMESGSEFEASESESESGEAISSSDGLKEYSDEDDNEDDIPLDPEVCSTSGSAPPLSSAPPTDDELVDEDSTEERSPPMALAREGKTTANRIKGKRNTKPAPTRDSFDERPRFQAPTSPAKVRAIKTTQVNTKASVQAALPVIRRGRRNPENLRAWENQHPEDTRLVYDSRSRVAMNVQSTVIKDLLTIAIGDFKTDLAFERPIAQSKDRLIRQRQILLTSAKALKRPTIVTRLKSDESYFRDILAVPEHRITKFRGDIKKATAPLIKEQFGLNPGIDCQARVARLLEDMEYIYPGDTMKNTVNYNQPFDIAIIHNVLASQFFDGPKSIAVQNRDSFKSSVPGKPDELEIPEGMLILVLIIIFHCLEDWATGAQAPARDFQLSTVDKEYIKIIGFVGSLKDDQPSMYHRVMHQVFRKTCAIKDLDLVTQQSSHKSAFSKLVVDREDV